MAYYIKSEFVKIFAKGFATTKKKRIFHMLNYCFELPRWCGIFLSPYERYASDKEKMSLAVELSRQNVRMNSGGPFGAAVFEHDGQVISVGVNTVVSAGCCVAHAEIMAIIMAQAREGRPRLNENGGHYTLAASAQPCSMCFGVLFWAGIDRLICGATRQDVESITAFREGPVPEKWVELLHRNGIETNLEVCRESAVEPLREYVERGGETY